jgi:putative transposase
MHDPIRRNRISIRLRGYDYCSAGMYFVTACTHLKRCLFGDVCGGGVVLNESGRIVENGLLELSNRFQSLKIDAHVVMPNHVHAILAFFELHPEPSTPTLGAVVRHWKAASCRLVRSAADPSFGWQRNYYERIIRNEDELHRVRQYIADNPARWDRDEENPHAATP